jgi:hypothetical protein
VPFSVIPAKAGIQLIQDVLDPGVRRGDDQKDFLRTRQEWRFWNNSLKWPSEVGYLPLDPQDGSSKWWPINDND